MRAPSEWTTSRGKGSRLQRKRFFKIVYHESHDDCGNRTGSARTMWLAVNGAPLVGTTRTWAEAARGLAWPYSPQA